MTKILRLFITSASIMWFSSALFVERAHAQLSCTDFAKGLLSKAGVPMSRVSWILTALTPSSTAPPLIDQRTQTDPIFAKINENDLRAHDKDLEKAQQFVQSQMPSSPDNQKCISLMQEMHDSIQKELSQRDLENITPDESPNEFFGGVRKYQSEAKAHPQHYDSNPRAGGGAPPQRSSPGNTDGSGNSPAPGGGGCPPGVRCSMQPD